MTSTNHSSATGTRLKLAAPKIARMMYGAAIVRVPGAHINARYDSAITGTHILMKGRYALVRSMTGEVMAALTSPTRMRTAPAMPEVVSEKP